MKKLIVIIGILLFNFSYSQEDMIFDGIKVKTSIKVEDGDSKTKLILNGAGIRDKMWVNLYVQALYLTEPSNDPQKILDSEETIATRLHITSSLVTKKKLIIATDEAITNSYKGDLSTIRERLDMFLTFFETQLDKEGYADIVYSAKKQTTAVYINKKFIGEIPGKDFRKAVFGAWLEENCVDRTLKKRLLGM